MNLVLPLLFWLLACLGIGFAMYYKGRTGNATDSRPADLDRLIQENAHIKADLAEKTKKIGELTQELQAEKSEKDRMSGEGKRIFVEITNLKKDYSAISEDRDALKVQLTHFQAEEKRKSTDFDKKISQLEEVRNSLEDEKKRIRKDDEEKQIHEKENRDRMWAEHEEKVKTSLTELCRLPQYNFPIFDNKKLPEGFSGKLKPDCMIGFLSQYIIFDAKVSRSDNLQTYVSDNVKKTAEKINNDPRIYPMVFFIVPVEALMTLKKTHFQEQGLDFFIISPDAVPVVLASFKKISAYELAEQLDPRDRENIVSLIAEFDHHINMRNALDIIGSQTGVAVRSKMRNIKKDLKDEIRMKQEKMRIQQPSSADLKTLMIDAEIQQEEINSLTSPQAPIPSQFIRSADEIVNDN